ncbi:MAG: MATE family efflux transporter [Rubrivivax sp.]|nr:MATE family efflux transporter [Rubrivivax sp.]
MTEPILAPRSLWQHVVGSLRGEQHDYTRGSLPAAILLLAIPMVLEMALESTFALVDIWWVNRIDDGWFGIAPTGGAAVAAVGATEGLLSLVYAVAFGLGMAVTAMVARRVGEGDLPGAAIAGSQAIGLGLVLGIGLGVPCLLWAPELLSLMTDANPNTVAAGTGYARWMLGANVIVTLLFLQNAIFRGAGDPMLALKTLAVANGINLVLDPILIFGLGPIPALGIEGAAIATNIGRGAGVLMQLWILARGGRHLRVVRASLRWHGATLLQIARTSIGGIAQMVVATMAWVFLMRILASLSTEAVAGATIALRVLMFTLMPAWGMSNAAATLVGQNLGAGEPARAEAAVWRIGWMNMAFTLAMSAALLLWHDAIVALFTDDPAVVAIGGEWLSILAWSYAVYGWWMVAVQAFNGAGDTMTPTWINLVFFWLIQIPLAWALALPLGWGHSGVFWGVFFSETSVGLFTLWLFTRGRWKRARV